MKRVLWGVLFVATLMFDLGLGARAETKAPLFSSAPTALDNRACELQARLEYSKNAYLQVIDWAKERRKFKKEHPLQYMAKYYWFNVDGITLKRPEYVRQFRSEEKQAEAAIERIDQQIVYPLSGDAKAKQDLTKRLEEDLKNLEGSIGRMAGLHEMAFKGETNFPLETQGETCSRDSQETLPGSVRTTLADTSMALASHPETANQVEWQSDTPEEIARSEWLKTKFEEEGFDKDFLDLKKCQSFLALKQEKLRNLAKEDKIKKREQEERDAKRTREMVAKATKGKLGASSLGEQSEPSNRAVKLALAAIGQPKETAKQSDKNASASEAASTDKKDAKASKTGDTAKQADLASTDVSKEKNGELKGDPAAKTNKKAEKDAKDVRVLAQTEAKKKEYEQKREELELTLDDDATSTGKSKTAGVLDRKELDPKIELKEREKREAQAALERQKVLEKLKKEFVAKAEAEKAEQAKIAKAMEPQPLTKAEQEEISNKALRSKSDLVTAGQNMLSQYKKGATQSFEFADYFLETETREKEEQGKATSVEKFQKLYAKYVQSRKKYEQIAKNTAGSNDEKILAVSRAMNSDYLFQYVRDNAQIYDFLDRKGGNCVAETKFLSAVMKDLGLAPSKGTTLAVQVFDDHIQAVLYSSKTREVTNLTNGSKMQDLIAPVMKPEVLVHQYLVSEGKQTPTKYEDFLLEDMPKDIREKAKESLAQAEKQQGGLAGLLGKLSLGTNSKLNFPKSGVFFERGGGFNPPPKLATIGWAQGAFGGNAKDFFKSGSIDPKMWEAFGKMEEYEPPEVDYDKAQADLEKVISSSDYREYMKVRRDPTRLATEKYTPEQIAKIVESEDKLYKVLDGGDYVSGKNKIDGISPLRKKLGKDNPELAGLYEFSRQKREAYNKTGNAGDLEKQKYFDLFRGLGVKNWKLYKDVERAHLNEHLLAEAIDKPGLGYWEGPTGLDTYVSNRDKVGYLANYQRDLKEDKKAAQTKQPKEKEMLPGRADGDLTSRDLPATKTPARTGFGNDPKGIKFKPETAAFTKLEPGDFAQFLAQADKEFDGCRGNCTNYRADYDAHQRAYGRWTPGLSAAVRDKKQFEPEFVEWLGSGGYRKIANAREESKRVIAGPDGKNIPKDIAVLLVDVLRDKDGTSANKSALKREIASNYGSVEKYIDQVKSEFLEEKKPVELAKKEDKPDKTSNLDVFKRLAKDKNIEASIFDGAEKKAFEYRTRQAETLTVGSSSSEQGRYDNEPQRQVRITKGYAIGLTPITQLQWFLVMGDNPSRFKEADSADGDHQMLGTVPANINHPVEQVSWDDTQKFIAKLTAQDGKCIYRLPTEAEYEAAARAKTQTAYSFGNDPSSLADNGWYNQNSGSRTHSVAMKKPNPDGLYDMQGNVWAWVEDWYADNPPGGDDPRGAQSGSYRVVRGGGWSLYAGSLRSARRGSNSPGDRSYDLGFRLVRTCP